MKDYGNIIGSTCDIIRCRLIGDMEELQRVARDLYLKQAIGSGDCPYFAIRDTNLNVFDGFPLLIDDAPFY